MSMITLDFDLGFPPDWREIVGNILEEWLPLVEGDVRKISITLKGASDDDEGEASIVVKKRYHVAHLRMDPIFFGLAERDQRLTLLHEMLHIVLDDLTREIRHLIFHFIPEGSQEYVEWRLEDAEERTTDALTHRIADLLSAVG